MLVNPKTFVLTDFRKKALLELENLIPFVEQFPSLEPLYGDVIKSLKEAEVTIQEELRTNPTVEEGDETYQFWADRAKKLFEEEYAKA